MSLYVQDVVFPKAAITTGARPYSHANSSSTAAATTPEFAALSGIDLYGETFTEGAWIP